MPPPFTVVKETVPVLPLQITRFKGWVTCPVGFTVILKVFEGPEQLLPALVNVGTTVIDAVTGDRPALTALNEGTLPTPAAASPIPGSGLLHEYVVVPTVLTVVKLIGVVATALHTT